MSEKFDAPLSYQAGSAGQEQGSALRLEDFTPQEIAGLEDMHNRFEHGYVSEWPDNHNKLRFARWLYEHGHIEG